MEFIKSSKWWNIFYKNGGLFNVQNDGIFSIKMVVYLLFKIAENLKIFQLFVIQNIRLFAFQNVKIKKWINISITNVIIIQNVKFWHLKKNTKWLTMIRIKTKLDTI